jgi:hypothetical protein
VVAVMLVLTVGNAAATSSVSYALSGAYAVSSPGPSCPPTHVCVNTYSFTGAASCQQGCSGFPSGANVTLDASGSSTKILPPSPCVSKDVSGTFSIAWSDATSSSGTLTGHSHDGKSYAFSGVISTGAYAGGSISSHVNLPPNPCLSSTFTGTLTLSPYPTPSRRALDEYRRLAREEQAVRCQAPLARSDIAGRAVPGACLQRCPSRKACALARQRPRQDKAAKLVLGRLQPGALPQVDVDRDLESVQYVRPERALRDSGERAFPGPGAERLPQVERVVADRERIPPPRRLKPDPDDDSPGTRAGERCVGGQIKRRILVGDG